MRLRAITRWVIVTSVANMADWFKGGTLLVALVAVFLGFREFQRSNRHQRLEFGNLYIQRYWQIDDDMLRSPKPQAA